MSNTYKHWTIVYEGIYFCAKLQANLGRMNTRKDQMRQTCSNLSLVQAQAILISISAAVFTVFYEGMKTENVMIPCYGFKFGI